MIVNIDPDLLKLIGRNKILEPTVETRMGLTTIRNDKLIELDLDTPYLYNSLGYRSEEFGNKELLIAGCSNTVGLGVPIEGTWGSMIANKIGVKHDNLSIVGSSIKLIVNNIFAYISKFGNPKTIMVVFPNLNRIHFPNFNNILKHETNFQVKYHYLTMSNNQDNIPKYSKRPHLLKETFPNEAVVYLNLQSILQLELYCKNLNIKLLYNTWDEMTEQLINSLKDKYNYSGFIGSVPKVEKKCHKELKNIFPNHFEYAADVNLPYYEGHFSVHTHAHYADFFYEAYKKI